MSKQSEVYACVDFDGTCVFHEYPKVGDTVPGAVNVLKEMQQQGIKIILYTMRSGIYLYDAKKWFKQNGIELFAVNKNPTQKIWTNSKKVYAHFYIDDAAVGAYLKKEEGKRPYIDWFRVRRELIVKKYHTLE